ncbi:MAG TPA: coproporphyrinogen III oxidase family protein [Burkholderiaceae bacterium]|nr:coproporphyrinogen III oxidase family protein [Burkholderiaceae bacterium]
MFNALIDAAFRHEAQRTVRLGPSEGIAGVPSSPVFLYLHVPFCNVLCPYCSFHRVHFEERRARRYFAALRREIRRYRDEGYVFSGVYVGGGTPTVLPEELADTLGLIRELSPGLAEISVETNPKDLREEVLKMLVAAGVDRLSVGVQTFDDGLLREMVRLEKYGSRAEILDHLAAAAGRFRTLNVDMIWNLPHQSTAMLEADLDTLLLSPANQASLYPLMTSPTAARRMAKALGKRHKARMGDYYDRILARLGSAFVPTSAWCFSRGGRSIDEYIVGAANYVGLGSGAFSYVDGVVYATTFSLQAYVERIDRGLTGVTGERPMSTRERMRYDLLVRLFGLRMEKDWVRAFYGKRFERTLRPELLGLKALGAITEDERGWSLTPRGMFLWVRMMSAFFESVDEFREQMRRHIQDELGDSAAAEIRLPLTEIGRAAGAPRGR